MQSKWQKKNSREDLSIHMMYEQDLISFQDFYRKTNEKKVTFNRKICAVHHFKLNTLITIDEYIRVELSPHVSRQKSIITFKSD